MNKVFFDECLPSLVAPEYRAAGIDTVTVGELGLFGTKDRKLVDLAKADGRAFMTLDKGIGNITVFPPADYAGLILLRPQVQLKPHILKMMRELIPLLLRETVAGKLWVVESDRVRVFGEPGA